VTKNFNGKSSPIKKEYQQFRWYSFFVKIDNLAPYEDIRISLPPLNLRDD